MLSLYDQISDMADRVEEAAALLRRMANGDADAARDLLTYCEGDQQEGNVLVFHVNHVVMEVLADEDVPAEE